MFSVFTVVDILLYCINITLLPILALNRKKAVMVQVVYSITVACPTKYRRRSHACDDHSSNDPAKFHVELLCNINKYHGRYKMSVLRRFR